MDKSLQSIAAGKPHLSPDGYIRLRMANLHRLRFIHLFSESDTGFLQELKSQTVPASSAGFSEWRSESDPSVSVGWGWFIHHDSRRLLLAPDGIRSNVMLIDAHGYDLGPRKTSVLFGTWLEDFEWEPSVTEALGEEAHSC